LAQRGEHLRFTQPAHVLDQRVAWCLPTEQQRPTDDQQLGVD